MWRVGRLRDLPPSVPAAGSGRGDKKKNGHVEINFSPNLHLSIARHYGESSASCLQSCGPRWSSVTSKGAGQGGGGGVAPCCNKGSHRQHNAMVFLYTVPPAAGPQSLLANRTTSAIAVGAESISIRAHDRGTPRTILVSRILCEMRRMTRYGGKGEVPGCR